MMEAVKVIEQIERGEFTGEASSIGGAASFAGLPSPHSPARQDEKIKCG
jgi:hypothetical protein